MGERPLFMGGLFFCVIFQGLHKKTRALFPFGQQHVDKLRDRVFYTRIAGFTLL